MKFFFLGVALLLTLSTLYASWPQSQYLPSLPDKSLNNDTVAFRVHVKNVQQQPIKEATISLKDSLDMEWQTDSKGNVVLSLAPKSSSITIFASGYITQTFLLPHVQGRNEITLSFQLKQNPMLQFQDS